ALGLGVKYDKEIVACPLTLGRVLAIAVGPDGTLYAVTAAGAAVPNWSAQRVVAINRDGTFQRTVIPPPSTVEREWIEAMGGVPVEIGGKTVPMVVHVNQRRHTGFQLRARHGQIAVTPDGHLLFVHPGEFIGLLDMTGSKAPPPLIAAKPLPSVSTASFMTLNPWVPERCYLAASSDGKYAYFSGLAKQRSPYGDKSKVIPPYPAVFRVKVPDRSPAEVFFGDLDETGNDKNLLGGPPAGMATDGNGNLLVCDPVNGRVVVISEADGKFVGSFAAAGAEFVAVNRATGEVYVLKPDRNDAKAELLKLKSWKDPSIVAMTVLTTPVWPKRGLEWQMAADPVARPPLLWVVNDASPLMRIEDLGNKFSSPAMIGGEDLGDGGFVGLTVDHFREAPEVYWRVSGTGYRIKFARYNEKADRVETFTINTCSTAAGSLVEPGPDGNLYAQGWPCQLYKCDRDGKPLQWEVPYRPKDDKEARAWPANAIYSRVTMVYMTHTLGIRGDGHLFVFDGHPEGKDGTHALFEYLPSGEGGPGPGRHPIIWGASDSIVGPRFDQDGNIYVAEQVRPLDQLIPPEFIGVTGPVTVKDGWPNNDPRAAIAQMYGSIVKFGPKGGCFEIEFYKRRQDEPAPDPTWKTIETATWIGQIHDRFSPSKVRGALWIQPGISQINLHYCNCENTRFDVDPYGRIWYPDLGRYRVGVLDANGNLIMSFGGYGNAESRGPDSPVVDSETGLVRPRRPNDASHLKSPFAEPDIAFAWLIGVGATDRYVYMGDSLNRRLLRARLVYATEATCDVK
ncbi:MAG: hypothetical protein N2255_02930, partial [Kiritimatiellae bacterium]|nr:hypothetical protein [Kiritimatiellia bacterium]